MAQSPIPFENGETLAEMLPHMPPPGVGVIATPASSPSNCASSPRTSSSAVDFMMKLLVGKIHWVMNTSAASVTFLSLSL